MLGMVSPRRTTMGSPGEQRPGESFSRESFKSSPKLPLCVSGFQARWCDFDSIERARNAHLTLIRSPLLETHVRN